MVLPVIIKRLKLLMGLLHGERTYTGPFYADIDITRRCNIRCPGCPYQSSKTKGPVPGDHSIKDLDLELVDRICQGLSRLKTSEVFLGGEGEPLLHPHLFKIISAFKRAGLKVQLFTNGTLLNEENTRKLTVSGLDVLRVSMWASTQHEYEKLYARARPEQLQTTINGVKLLTSLKAENKQPLPSVILTQPLNSYNS
ncbi:radical SAM protein [candidate division CSSED10-310 bacterium]|uniref:Radical SAM protein n=1 Tax=candidate division CSSED10-310 bacterium TaxID=2855610 RepID=A0ABV6YXL9_UNCC1